MIRVGEHRNFIIKMLADYNLREEWLAIVPSVQEWCQTKGIEEDNPFRIAKCICRSDGTRDIVFADKLTDAMIQSAKGSMVCRGFLSEVESLDTDFKFLVHTVLHEIACPELKTIDQATRDKWAFAHMERYAT
jgi:hypothetical protein